MMDFVFPNISSKEIESATSNAIYWWNRDEDYFHHNFKLLNRIYEDAETLDFFARIPFSQFTRLYSVRRTLPEGHESVVALLNGLKNFGFHKAVLAGESTVIDAASQFLKDDSITLRQTRSFLSKFAFLINPSAFSLYDSLAKNSLYECLPKTDGFTRNRLEPYQGFHEGVRVLFEHFEARSLFTYADEVLKAYPNSDAYKFFITNQGAFYRRVVDKYLWQRQQKTDDRLPGSAYLKFHRIGYSSTHDKN